MESDSKTPVPLDQSDESVAIGRVSIKAPPFMEGTVDGWFLILEAQFHLQNIRSEETRFFHVISCLPPNVIARLPQSCIQNHEYSQLKEQVTQLYEKTKPELFEELISKRPLVGRPSVRMSELQALAAKVGASDELVRHEFIKSLPSTISTVVAALKDLSLSQAAKLADELVPVSSGVSCMTVPGVAPVAAVTTRSCPVADTDASASVAAVTTRPYPAAGTDTPTSGSRTLQPFHRGQRPKICRGHIFYGPQARTCKPWCRWPRKRENLQIQPSSRSASPARGDPEN